MELSIQFAPAGLDWPATLVTLGAVVLGGLLTLLTTYLFERRKELSERRAKAFELLLKVQDLVNSTLTLGRQITQGIAAAEAAGVDGPAWTKIESIAGIANYEVTLLPAELAVLTYGHHYDLIQDVSELRTGYNGLVRGLSLFAEMKDVVGRTVGPQMQGRVASFDGDWSRHPELGTTVANLDALGENLVEAMNRLAAKARAIGPSFSAVLRAELKDPAFPQIVVDESLEA